MTCKACDGEGSVMMHRDGTWLECRDCEGTGRDPADGPTEQQISDWMNTSPPAPFTMADKDAPERYRP